MARPVRQDHELRRLLFFGHRYADKVRVGRSEDASVGGDNVDLVKFALAGDEGHAVGGLGRRGAEIGHDGIRRVHQHGVYRGHHGRVVVEHREVEHRLRLQVGAARQDAPVEGEEHRVEKRGRPGECLPPLVHGFGEVWRFGSLEVWREERRKCAMRPLIRFASVASAS